MPVYVLAAIVGALAAAGFLISPLRLDAAAFAPVPVVTGFMLLIAWCLRGRGLARIAGALEATALFTALCLPFTFLTFLVSANGLPLIDPQLAAVDRWMLPGFDWPSAAIAFSRLALPLDIANFAYASIRWQPYLLFLLLCAAGHSGRCWTFLLTWGLCLGGVTAVAGLLPALGPYPHFGIAAEAVPGITAKAAWETPALMAALRSGELVLIRPDVLNGVVTFPSFHAAAAILLGWGFWALRWIRWPAVALNIAMFLAAVPIGGHYVVDILAGAAAAVLAIKVAVILDRGTLTRSAKSG